ncbi:ABC transporter permease subunit [Klebsiella pneumoniae]
MTTFTDWDIIRNLLLAGRWTVLLSLVAFTGGALVTLPLLLLRLTGGRQVKRLIRGYIELFQGTPLLMQLFLAFFGVALFGVDVSAWTAASVALTLYTSAFLLDIWFGSIRALPKGQWEASRCLGLSFGQTLYRVVAPQALRIAGRRQLSFAAEEYYRIAATACDSHLQAVLSEAVVAVQGRSLTLPSGAGHDAIAIAERWPSAMLFVRCLGGVSHHPAESVTAADVGLAIDAFSRAVEKVADA